MRIPVGSALSLIFSFFFSFPHSLSPSGWVFSQSQSPIYVRYRPLEIQSVVRKRKPLFLVGSQPQSHRNPLVLRATDEGDKHNMKHLHLVFFRAAVILRDDRRKCRGRADRATDGYAV